MSKNNLYIFLILLAFTLGSCKSAKISSAVKDGDIYKSLYNKSLNADFKYVSCDQIDVYLNDGEEKNFKAKIFIERGNYIFVSLNFLGIELARSLITQDSLIIINRVEKSYYRGSYSAIGKILKFNITFSALEQLLIKGIVFDKKDSKKIFYNRIFDRDNYFCYEYFDENQNSVKSFFNKNSFIEEKIVIENKSSNLIIDTKLNYNSATGSYPDLINFSLKQEDYFLVGELRCKNISFEKFDKKTLNVNNKYREVVY